MAKKIDYASMFTFRKDGRYQAKYTDGAGTHVLYDRDPEKLFYKLQDAKQTKAPEEPTFKEVAELWERDHREEITPRTWNNYRPHYEAILAKHGHKKFSEVSSLDIVNELSAAKAAGYSATVVNSIRCIYRMIYDYAVVNEYAKYNPVSSIRLPKGLKRGKRIAPTDKQMKIICSSLDAPFGLFPFFLLCTGLRKSEALALTWSDIVFAKKEILITKSLDYTCGASPKLKPPKTEAGNRVVPILDVLYEPLMQSKKESKSIYLFPASDSSRGRKGGGLMTLRGYEGAWLRYCQSVGLMDGEKPALTAHNLRHGTATLMFELGVDELTAQRILGHSRIEITREIYTDLRAAQNKKSLKRMNTGMRKYMKNA